MWTKVFRMASRTIAMLVSVSLLSGCLETFQAGTNTNVTAGQDGPTIQEAQTVAYNGPKARLAVARFTNKAGGQWWNPQIGDGMADQLATSLVQTNRYIVLERQNLDVVTAEQDLARAGRIQQGTEAPTGQIEGAELLIVGAVTEFSGNSSGAQGGVGGGGGGVFGAVLGGFRKAHMAIDLRIVDARTSRILMATSVEGEANDVNLGGAVGGYFGGGALAGGLSGWKNTPREKALRQVIHEAVKVIISKTPHTYYRHDAQRLVRPAAVTSPAPTPSPAAVPSLNGPPSRETIKEMQMILSGLGYDVGRPDGLMGPRTARALRAFQSANGLKATGDLSPATISTLKSSAR